MGEIDGLPIPHAWDVRETTDKYEHPSASECRERGAPGIFQDAGRIEAHEPEDDGSPTRPQDQVASGEHGGAKSQTEALPPTPPESEE